MFGNILKEAMYGYGDDDPNGANRGQTTYGQGPPRRSGSSRTYKSKPKTIKPSTSKGPKLPDLPKSFSNSPAQSKSTTDNSGGPKLPKIPKSFFESKEPVLPKIQPRPSVIRPPRPMIDNSIGDPGGMADIFKNDVIEQQRYQAPPQQRYPDEYPDEQQQYQEARRQPMFGDPRGYGSILRPPGFNEANYPGMTRGY